MDLDSKRNNYHTQLTRLQGNQFIEVFRLEEIGDNTVFENYHRYDFYQLLWFTKVSGNTNYFLDFNEYTIADNQLILIFPGQIDMLDEQGKEGYLFAIHADNFFRINQRMQSDYLNGYYSNVFIIPDEETTQTLKSLIQLIENEYNDNNRILLMENYLEAFLFHVSASFEKSGISPNAPDLLVAKLMKLIDKHFITQRETVFYADALDLTYKKLNEIALQGTGKTVKQHLQERLILEMKKEIRLREKNLKEIAFSLGFSEPGYFTRFFKQHTGITPTEFRDGRL